MRPRSSGSACRSPRPTSAQYEFTSQFEGAERIADKWGITRAGLRRLRPASQQRAAAAWAEDRFDTPDRRRSTRPTSTTTASRPAPPTASTATRACARPRSRALADAQARRPRGRRAHRRLVVADLRRRRRGAAHDRREGRGARPHPARRVVDTCLVGVDPVLMLTGPIDATQHLLDRTGLTHRRHRRHRDQRGVRLGRARLGQRELERRPRHGQPQRRRDRARSPARRHRRVPAHQGAARARADRRRPTRSSRMCCGGGLGTGTHPRSGSDADGDRLRPDTLRARRGHRRRARRCSLRRAAAPTGRADPATPRANATVVRVVDGDTIVVDLGGTDERLRLIGIDTPETSNRRRPVECFGTEASAPAKELLPEGTAIRLERDAEARDRYDRLLAYVYRASDGAVRQPAHGHRRVRQPVHVPAERRARRPVPHRRRAAQDAGVGLWSACEHPFEE